MPARTRADLLRNNVVIDGSLASDTSADVPGRVRDTMRVLLKFTRSIHIQWQDLDYFERNLDALSDGYRREGGHSLKPPADAFFGENHPAGSENADKERAKKSANDEVGECVEIAKGFKKHERQLEDDLTDRYRFAIFRGPDQLYSSYAEKSKITWTLHRNVPWTEDFPILDPESTGVPGSKPDLFYGLRVVRSNQDDMLMNRDPTHFDNLTIDILGNLRSIGVLSTITKALVENFDDDLSKMTESLCALDSHNLTCFPFAVVELKKEKTGSTEAEVCECQAASASARALSLYKLIYEEAYWKNDKKSPLRLARQPPPIVAFTCIGSKVRVWLTYLKREKTIMRCIYSTDLVLGWGVLSLRRIVKNMLFWQADIVLRYLHPALDSLRVVHDIGRRDTIYDSDGTTQHDVVDIPAPERHLTRTPEPVEEHTHDADRADVDLHTDWRKQPVVLFGSSDTYTSPGAQENSLSGQSTTPQAHLKSPHAEIGLTQTRPPLPPAQSNSSLAQADSCSAQPSTTQKARKTSEVQDKKIDFTFGSNAYPTEPKFAPSWTHPSHIKVPPLEQSIFSFGSNISTSSRSSSDPFLVNIPQRPALSSAFSEGARARSTTRKSTSPGAEILHQQTRDAQSPRDNVFTRGRKGSAKPPLRSKFNATVEDVGPESS